MNLTWTKYPAGAEAFLFDGWIGLYVVSEKSRFALYLYSNRNDGRGVRVPVKGKTVDEVIQKTERWLKEELRNILRDRPPSKVTRHYRQDGTIARIEYPDGTVDYYK